MAASSQSRTLTVVIPAFNELENLKVLLPRLLRVQSALPGFLLCPLVVLPTTAQGNEIRAIRQLGAQVAIRKPTDSFGDAIRSGIEALSDSTEYVIFMDADGSHSPDRIPALVERASGADIVVASRYVRGGNSDNSRLLKIMSIALNRAYSVVLGIKCKDVSTNFKLYKAEDLRQVALQCNNFDIVEELIFRVQILKAPHQLRICEIPDHFAQRQIGTTKRRLGPYIASYLWTLARLRFTTRRQGPVRTKRKEGLPL